MHSAQTLTVINLGVLDFSLTGILSSLANPLAENNISIFCHFNF